MSVDRIASYATQGSLMAQALRLQSTYATGQAQTSSGLKSEHFSGIATDSQKLLSLDAQFATLTAQASAITTAQTKLTAMQSATSSISDLLNTITSQLTQSISSSNASNTSAITASQASTWRDELATLLNTTQGGSYLFGGTVTGTAPVDITSVYYDPTIDPTVADTDYYQGNQTTASVRASNTLRVDYGVTADHTAFEQAFRALSMIAANPTDTTTLNSAYDLIKNASNGVADITSILASKADVLTQEANTNAATLSYLDTHISDLRNVDVAEVSVQLSQIETQLEASYSTLTALLKLNLSSYVR